MTKKKLQLCHPMSMSLSLFTLELMLLQNKLECLFLTIFWLVLIFVGNDWVYLSGVPLLAWKFLPRRNTLAYFSETEEKRLITFLPGHGRVLRRAETWVEASSVASADGASVAVVDADFALPVPKMRSASRMMTCKKSILERKKSFKFNPVRQTAEWP